MTVRNYKLDKAELEIENAVKDGEYKNVKNFDKEKSKYQKLAKVHNEVSHTKHH